MEELKLFGAWPSRFAYRVIWALKLKGIDYEYIEEDLTNKSALLLQYNPIHKKIPVLVHVGKPIAESMVILEYIDETWPQCPLLPKDPYKRSTARFWAKYADDKGKCIGLLLRTGDVQQRAIKESLEFLKTVEKYGLGEKKFFGGDSIGLADLAFGSIAHWLGIIEDLVDVKVLDSDAFPRLHAWTENFKAVATIKENLPDPDEMLVYFKGQRAIMLASHSH